LNRTFLPASNMVLLHSSLYLFILIITSGIPTDNSKEKIDYIHPWLSTHTHCSKWGTLLILISLDMHTMNLKFEEGHLGKIIIMMWLVDHF
jgi:hypothetical protein